MSQTAYGLQQTPQPGVRGGISTSDLVASALNQDGTWNIPFGVAVCRNGVSTVNSSQILAKMPSSATGEFLGVSLLAHVYDPGPFGTLNQSGTVGTSPGPGVLQNQQISVLRKGLVWVVVETDVTVTAGNQAYVRYSQNSTGKLQLGAFRADGDTSHAVAANARFMSSAFTVPATTPYPGQSAGAASSAYPAVGATVTAALVEIDFSAMLALTTGSH
jgi:hypothetical protein